MLFGFSQNMVRASCFKPLFLFSPSPDDVLAKVKTSPPCAEAGTHRSGTSGAQTPAQRVFSPFFFGWVGDRAIAALADAF